jgi:hypothetical protein
LPASGDLPGVSPDTPLSASSRYHTRLRQETAHRELAEEPLLSSRPDVAAAREELRALKEIQALDRDGIRAFAARLKGADSSPVASMPAAHLTSYPSAKWWTAGNPAPTQVAGGLSVGRPA